MTANFIYLLSCLLFLGQKTTALQFMPGSSCAAVCLDNSEDDPRDPAASSTNSSDIVCNDQEYSTTANGIRFKACSECLQESHAVSDQESDISWYLYNLRYSVDVCLYGFPNVTRTVSSPCDIDFACQPLQKALEAGNLNPDNGTQLDYCTADGGAFTGSQLHDCIQCFRSSSNQFIMSNILTALQAGCEQKPQPGNLIGLSGSLFTQFEVNITAPPQNQTATSNDSSHTTMTTGAIVGIAVGATLLILGGIALFWVYHRKQKYLYGDPLGSQGGRKSITPPPVAPYTRYYENRKDSLPADWELRAQQPYAHNAQYYDQMEKVIQGIQNPYHAVNPNQSSYGPHSTLPTHPAYMPRVASRTGSRTDTPSPPPLFKSNKPDSYIMNAYLNAAAAASAPTTSATIPAASSTTTNATHPPPSRPQPQIQQLHQATPPTHRGPPANRAAPPPPPPPPPAQQAPRLSLPVPQARKPTKYLPPNIHVDNTSSKPAEGVDVSIGLDVSDLGGGGGGSGGLGLRWEQSSDAGYGTKTGGASPGLLFQRGLGPAEQRAVERHAADRRRRDTEFVDG
ncbi:hypothetical protein GGR54DRAFT_554642 [Hypoxylon sp. NC1633]|nr:hypothetical protein GGR54DRAFT_554642 [Hypoxylon sp. NC1633]